MPFGRERPLLAWPHPIPHIDHRSLAHKESLKMFEGFRCVKALGSKGSAKPATSKRSSAAIGVVDAAGTRKRSGHVPTAIPKEANHDGRSEQSQGIESTPSSSAAKSGLLEKLGDQPLRLVIIGHNPSDHAWSSGHYYSNPNNWMWRILKETGIAPMAIRGAEDDGLMPQLAGVGLTDVGTGTPGTQSSQFKAAHFEAWRGPFFERLLQHTQRASAVLGCSCGCCGAPALVAFSGKRQFQELFQGAAPRAAKVAKGTGAVGAGTAAEAAGLVPHQQEQRRGAGAGVGGAAGSAGGPSQQAGPTSSEVAMSVTASPAAAEGEEAAAAAAAAATAPTAVQGVRYQRQRPASIATGVQRVLPEGWPLPPWTEVWVMSSTSGAAAMTREQRLGPWRELAWRLQREPWPRQAVLRCNRGEGGSS